MRKHLIFAVLLLAGCGKPTAPVEGTAPIVNKWEYANFSFEHYTSDRHLVHTVAVLKTFHEGGMPAWTPPEKCYQLTDALNVIGKYGWEYVSQEADKVMVRRPYKTIQDGAFVVGLTNLPE